VPASCVKSVCVCVRACVRACGESASETSSAELYVNSHANDKNTVLTVV